MMRTLVKAPAGLLLAGCVMLLLLGGCSRAAETTPSVSPASAHTPAPLPTNPTPEPSATIAATSAALSSPTAAPTTALIASATPSRTPTATKAPTATATPTLGPTPDGVVRELRVPILMYHYISEPPAEADIYRRDMSVTPERFESHLQYLRQAGYETITLDDLLYALAQGRSLPPKPIILTFDDGYEDNYLNAFPLLEKYDMIGHFSIMSDVINAETPGYMTWSQIEQMSAAGQHFGSHARYHIPSQKGGTTEYLVWHALGAMEAIQEHLGYHPRWITYPSGEYDAQTIAVYRSAYYWGGLSTEQGATHTLDDIFALKRVRVRGGHTAEDLAGLLALDW